MNCNHCGAPLLPGEKFCTSCGASVTQTNQQTAPQQPQNYGDPYQQTRQAPQQNRYQQPVYPQNQPEYHVGEHVSTWGWIARELLTAIPIVGVIMLFVWAFGSSKRRSLQTWARAQLLVLLITVIITVIIVVITLAAGKSLGDFGGSSYRYY